MPAPTPAARAFSAALAAALRALPSITEDKPGYHAGIERIRTLIIQQGGAVKSDWNGSRIRIHGITASATSGVAQACHNWIAQVTLKSAAAVMAGQS